MGLFWLEKGELTPYGLSYEHDGGELLPVFSAADIMSRKVVTAGPDEPLPAALARMRQGRFRHLPVTEGQRLVGILSDRDGLSLGPEAEELTVGEAMVTELITATQEAGIPDLARAVVEYRISCLPVLDENGFLVGIVTTVDLLRSMAHRAPVDLWI